MQRAHKRPIWLGLLAASLTPTLCLLIWSIVFLANPSAETFGYEALLIVVFPTCFALLVALILMLPFVLWLRARGRLTATWVCTGTAFAGVVPVPFLYSPLVPDRPVFDALPPSLFFVFALLGLLAGVVFCVVSGVAFRSGSRAPMAAPDAALAKTVDIGDR